MNLGNLLKISFRALSNNKMRAFLTMLGIIIGVASVITMLAIGQGSKVSIQSQISEMGSNLIMIHPGAGQMGGVRLSRSEMQSLEMDDYDAIRENVTAIKHLSPSVTSSGQFIYGSNNYPSSLTGVNTEYLDIRVLKVDDGTLFTDQQVRSSAKVCVIGQTVVKNLFTNGEDPVGQVIRFNKIPFTVIGTLEAKGYNSMGMDQDDVVLAPYTTVQKRILAITHLHGIYASAVSETATFEATDAITGLLRTNHKLKAGEEDDFSIRTQEEISSMLTSTTNTMTILLACIAGISLLVGGIGIMNIMYVSVKERTREIGLRMSIGAKGRDILAQFLIEAIIISITGGLIGITLGVGASLLVKWVVAWPISVQAYAVFLSFLVCSITGIFFGWYPAKKASELDPIEALRYE
ncbi:MAG: FtsX-like permease family protein [Bacteroidales bacterium]|nr:FtsX-like permease family protein [Bacteroidales bacterium]